MSRASQVQGGDSGVSAGDQALRLARVENVGAATGVVGAAQEEAAKANQEASVIKKEAKQEIKKEAKQGDKLE